MPIVRSSRTGTRGSHTVRWLWSWIGRERERRGITRSDFARLVGARRETLYRAENRQMDSSASLLLDSLDKLGALGAVAEIDAMNWKGSVLSLSEKEAERYDAIADDSGLSRDAVIRQLAAEGFIARVRPAPRPPKRRAGSDRLAFVEVGVWYDELNEKIEVRSVSEGEPLAFTVKREDGDLFERLGRVLRKAGVAGPDRA